MSRYCDICQLDEEDHLKEGEEYEDHGYVEDHEFECREEDDG